MNSKYSNVLTILLVVVILAIIGIVGFLGYKFYKANSMEKDAENFVDSFLNDSNLNKDNDNEVIGDGDMFAGIEGGNSGSSQGGKTQKYQGFEMVGTIEIPATNVKQVILAQSELGKKALETAVVEIYGNGLNQPGNTTIAGHNYRNGQFFSNNKKLNIGDKIYITDLSGQRLSYTIYNKYEAEENESDYMTRDTQGAIEISLSTCTDDSKARLIIWAKADV